MQKMQNIGAVTMLLGVVIFVIGGLFFLVAAFRESILWGLACLFIPIASIFFLIMHWPVAKKPFFIQLAGCAVTLVGAIIGSRTLHH
jgi:hypothetical protein